MQSSEPPSNPFELMKASWGNKEALLKLGVEPTLNRKGCTYHIIGQPEQHWLSSLPHSSLPLLDIGACYGVQTTYALKSGRDVIALDMCDEHLAVLSQRVATLRGPRLGKLIRTVVTQLPDVDAIAEESVSGILCFEVLHFYKPGQLRPQFNHFFKWLAPNGKLVVSTGSWPPSIHRWEEPEPGTMLSEGRSPKGSLELLKTLSPSELVDAAPGMKFFSDESPLNKIVGDFLYTMSTEELRELAECSGFVVEEATYYNSRKYGTDKSHMEPENVFLVARKPGNAVS